MAVDLPAEDHAAALVRSVTDEPQGSLQGLGIAGSERAKCELLALSQHQQTICDSLLMGMTLIVEFVTDVNGPIPVRWTARVTSEDSSAAHRAAMAAVKASLSVAEIERGLPAPSLCEVEASHSQPLCATVLPSEQSGISAAIGYNAQVPLSASYEFARVPSSRETDVDTVLSYLLGLRRPMALRCLVQRVELTRREIRLLERTLAAHTDERWASLTSCAALLQVSAELLSGSPIDSEIAKVASHFLFGPASQPERNVTTERPWFHQKVWVPLLLPSAAFLRSIGVVPVRLPTGSLLPLEGTRLGHIGGSDVVLRLSPQDRQRHIYCVGGSGTGKSTLLLNMLEADMRDGRGVCLLDPHGDLFEESVRRVPPNRINDVVVVDPYSRSSEVAVNLLEFFGHRQELGPTVISNELISIFDELYDLERTGGPVFESYLRHAAMLVMSADPLATISDIVRVFEDSGYRKALVELCPDAPIRSFWSEQAEKASGELSLRNIAPYVTSKLNRFVSNALIGPIVSKATSTVRFDHILDQSRIVLANLAVGHLGRLDSRFLGMILLDKILEAAVMQVGRRREERRDFTVYLDEFQDFAGSTLDAILSGGRKFNLHLVMAHQSLTQLTSRRHGSRLVDSVLANAPTKLMFRLNGSDATALSRELGAGLQAEDLVALPDFTALGHVSLNGRRRHTVRFSTYPA